MRVLTVTHLSYLIKRNCVLLRQSLIFGYGKEVVSDQSIVSSCVLEYLLSELETCLVSCIACSSHLGKDLLVIFRICDYGYVLVVLSSCTKHGRTTDIDVLDALFKSNARLLDSRLERIEVNNDHVDQTDAELFYSLHVLRVTAHSEDTTVEERVQCLNTSVEALRETCDFGNFLTRDALLLEKLCSTACREDLYVQFYEFSGKIGNACFVGYTDNRSFNHKNILSEPLLFGSNQIINYFDLTVGDELDRFREDNLFTFHHDALLKCFRCVVFSYVDGLLQNDRAFVVMFIYEMHRRAGHFYALCQNSFVRADAVHALTAERRDQGRVDIDNAVCVSRDRLRAEHGEESGQNDQVHTETVEFGKCGIVVIVAEHFLADDFARDPRLLCSFDGKSTFVARDDFGDLDISDLSACDLINDRLQVRTAAADKNCYLHSMLLRSCAENLRRCCSERLPGRYRRSMRSSDRKARPL